MKFSAENKALTHIAAFLGGAAVFCGSRDTLLSVLVAMVVVLLIWGATK